MERMLALLLILPASFVGFADDKCESKQPTSLKERIVTFPTDRSIGEAYFLDPLSEKVADEESVPAKGKVAVPAGKSLMLVFFDPKQEDNTPVDLSVLDQLGPNDLQMLAIPFSLITAESLKPLIRHRSLKFLGLGPLSKVTDETLAPLAEMTWLEAFAVSEAEVSDAGLKHLSKLVKLNALHLTSTKITDAGLIHLKQMTKLKTLDLKHNKITNEGLKHLAGLTELEHFHFSSIKITGSGLIHLKKMTKLKSLDLMSIDTGADLDHLKPLGKLEWLRLAGDRIDDGALEQLTHLRHLKLLLLVDTKVTEAGAKKLQQALPDCEIRR